MKKEKKIKKNILRAGILAVLTISLAIILIIASVELGIFLWNVPISDKMSDMYAMYALFRKTLVYFESMITIYIYIVIIDLCVDIFKYIGRQNQKLRRLKKLRR